MTITELIKFDKLKEENEELKKELAKLKQTQLFKEDFKIFYSYGLDPKIISYRLKNNSKYDKLPSKDVK